MSYIVQQCGCDHVSGPLARDALPKWQLAVDAAEAGNEALHHVRGTESVGESRVLGTRKGQRSQAQLTNPTEALNLLRFEQRYDNGVFFALKGDKTMHRVAQDHERPLPW